MLKSFASFEFLEKDDSEMVEKLLRVFANFFVSETVAMDFIKNHSGSYKDMLRQLRFFVNQANKDNQTLMMSLFGFLTNVFFYENNTIGYNDFELSKLKLDLVSIICYLVATPLPEPLLTEGLRTIANLSRSKQVAKHICSVDFGDGLVALLNHESQNAVFYAFGCLVNLSNDKVFYEKKSDGEYMGYLRTAQFDSIEVIQLVLQVFCNMLNFYKRERIDIKGTRAYKDVDQILKRIKDMASFDDNKENGSVEKGQIRSMIDFAERVLEDDKADFAPLKLNELLN